VPDIAPAWTATSASAGTAQGRGAVAARSGGSGEEPPRVAISVSTPVYAFIANGATTTTFSFTSIADPLYVRVAHAATGTWPCTGITYGGAAPRTGRRRWRTRT
jgi:hypothetical protein